jgi:hypothetical protein
LLLLLLLLLLDDNKIQGTLKKVTQPTLDSTATNRTSSPPAYSNYGLGNNNPQVLITILSIAVLISKNQGKKQGKGKRWE